MVDLVLQADHAEPFGQLSVVVAEVVGPQIVGPSILTEVFDETLAAGVVVAVGQRRQLAAVEQVFLSCQEVVDELSQRTCPWLIQGHSRLSVASAISPFGSVRHEPNFSKRPRTFFAHCPLGCANNAKWRR